MSTYADLFAAFGMDWSEARQQSEKYKAPIEALNPFFLEEMEGIASGAGVDLSDILVLNSRTELLSLDGSAMLKDKVSTKSGDSAAKIAKTATDIHDNGECTSICVAPISSSDGHTIFAQNWDWKARQSEALVILHTIDTNGCLISTLTEAGQLAKIGLSSRGLAVGLNLIRSQGDGQAPGVPIHCLLRHLLALDSLAAVRAALADLHRALGFAAASNIPCADASGAVACFEVSPRYGCP